MVAPVKLSCAMCATEMEFDESQVPPCEFLCASCNLRDSIAELIWDAYPELAHGGVPCRWDDYREYFYRPGLQHRPERSAYGITVIACYRAADAIIASLGIDTKQDERT